MARVAPNSSQVQPTLTEKENVTIFIGTLSSTYYGRLIGHVGASFANLAQTEERIEDGSKLESSKITRHYLSNPPAGQGA